MWGYSHNRGFCLFLCCCACFQGVGSLEVRLTARHVQVLLALTLGDALVRSNV